MEVTQFTYFQQVGGVECYPVTGEITYGLERLAIYLQGVDSVYDLIWADGPFGTVTYGDVFHQNEVEQSTYNFEHANVPKLFELFDFYESEANRLMAAELPLPAYEMVVKASHTFNLLDARRAISVTARQQYILRVRSLACSIAQSYLLARAKLGFPMATPNCVTKCWPAGGCRMSALDFLVELGTEELPPKALAKLGGSLLRRHREGPEGRRPALPRLQAYAAPRRLAVLVEQLATQQPDCSINLDGPPMQAAFDAHGEPTQAALVSPANVAWTWPKSTAAGPSSSSAAPSKVSPPPSCCRVSSRLR